MSTTKSYLHQGDKLAFRNELNEGRLFAQFSLMAMNRFKWENLPSGITSYILEKSLYHNGELTFYNDPMLGLIALPSAATDLNVYGEPNNLILNGIGYNRTVSVDDCVRVKANDLAVPTRIQVKHYTDFIAEIESVMYQNLRQQRFPYIIPTTKDDELTVRNMVKKVMDGDEAIYCDKRISASGQPIQAINTASPFLLDKLQSHKNDCMNELLSFLGLNNKQTEKKERLLVDEVNVNNGQILMSLDLEYKTRQLACEEINNKYGTNISVTKTIDELSISFLGGEEEDGTLHGGTTGNNQQQ